MTSWQKYVDAVILFTDDIDRSRLFYQDALGMSPDRHATDFWFGETLVMLLERAEAAGQVAPATLAPPGAGSQLVVTITVPDVAACCSELASRGVTFTGHRPSRATARFADPSGYLWELVGPAQASPEQTDSSQGWTDAPKDIDHITVTVPDLAAARSFYDDILGLTAEPAGLDAVSYRFANMGVNLVTGHSTPGASFQLTNFMDPDLCDVDTAAAELTRHGVPLLSGPADRPWGKRTVMFKDPANCIWELVQDVAKPEPTPSY